MDSLRSWLPTLPQLADVFSVAPGVDLGQAQIVRLPCHSNSGLTVAREWLRCPLLGFPRARSPAGGCLSHSRFANHHGKDGVGGDFFHGTQASHLSSIVASRSLADATETVHGDVGAYASDEFPLAEQYAFPERLGSSELRLQCVLGGRTFHLKRSGSNPHSFVIQRVVIEYSELTHVFFGLWPDDDALCCKRKYYRFRPIGGD